jgi:hypothetical protein
MFYRADKKCVALLASADILLNIRGDSASPTPNPNFKLTRDKQ